MIIDQLRYIFLKNFNNRPQHEALWFIPQSLVLRSIVNCVRLKIGLFRNALHSTNASWPHVFCTLLPFKNRLKYNWNPSIAACYGIGEGLCNFCYLEAT